VGFRTLNFFILSIGLTTTLHSCEIHYKSGVEKDLQKELIPWSLVLPAAERLKELNKLLEDVAKIAVSNGPRGAIRFAQGIKAFVTMGGEYLFQLLIVNYHFCQ